MPHYVAFYLVFTVCQNTHLRDLQVVKQSIGWIFSTQKAKIASTNVINRGSYISAYVLLISLNKLGKRAKIRGLPAILSLFGNKFN